MTPLRRTPVVLGLAAAVLVGAVSSAAGQANPPVPLPANPTGLRPPVGQPAEAETLAGYLPQVSCKPTAMAGVRRLRDLVLATYQRGYDGGSARSCVQGGQSEHKEGRAWDWMLNVNNARNGRAAGDFLAWLTRRGPDGERGVQARRLGIMYVIYNRRIWSSYRADEGWRVYSGSSPHTDHIHLSFSWAGARAATSFWTGKVSPVDYGRCSAFYGQPARLSGKPRRTPCRAQAQLVKRSSRANEQLGSGNAASMRAAQTRLGIRRTGRFDRATWAAVMEYQREHELPVTGVLDQPTWSSLDPTTVLWSVTAGYGPARAADYGARNYSRIVVRRGYAGAPVAFLQTAVRLPAAERNGAYGKKTATVVRAFKVAHGLADNSIVDGAVWRALAAAS